MKLADGILSDIRAMRVHTGADPEFVLLTIQEVKRLEAEMSGFLAKSSRDGEPLSFAGIPIQLVQ